VRTAVTHQRVSDDVSVDRVNRVNREQHDDRARAETAGRTGRNGGQVWRNIGSLRTLLARAERELAREPGAYVAVAVVHGDKREEQAGRWGWAGSREAGGQVAGLGARLVPGDRGLRVRVHREGGALVGSTLLRRTVAATEARLAPVDDKAAARDASRLAAMEAQLADLLARVAARDREIALLNATIEEMGPVNARMGNLHARLDDLEAVAHRHEDDGQEEGEEDDDTDDEPDEVDDE
jgi:hypothetical protein